MNRNFKDSAYLVCINRCVSPITMDRKLTEIKLLPEPHPLEIEAVKGEQQRVFIKEKAISYFKRPVHSRERSCYEVFTKNPGMYPPFYVHSRPYDKYK